MTAVDLASPGGRGWLARIGGERIGMWLAIAGVAAFLILAIALPLVAVFVKAFQNANGTFVGFANFAAYFRSPALSMSIWNSLWVTTLATVITVLLAFLFAYGLVRTSMPGRGLLRLIGISPLLPPSMLPAISLVYLFGNQGLIKGLLMGQPIYGPIGMVLGLVYYAFPHALMILVAALGLTDARLYEAAEALGTSRVRTFLTVTLPSARFGLVSATAVTFTICLTDFGVAKVIGGRFNVLATDVFKQVVGQNNFEMGAVVGIILLLPAVLSFGVTRWVERRQKSALSSRAVVYVPQPSAGRDLTYLIFCTVVAFLLIVMMATAAYASVVKLWPYNLSFSLGNYDFAEHDSDGWQSFWNSLIMAANVALWGTALIFIGAYLVEKSPVGGVFREIIRVMAILPMAVPGLVLGIAYIFFFNQPLNPLNGLMGTLTLMVINTIAHYYTVSHLTAQTVLKQLDPEFEAVTASLQVPQWKTFLKVTLPVCLPTVLDIFSYMFSIALTTAAALVFLFGSETKVASVAVIAMDDAGNTAAAAAMAMMIVFASVAMRVVNAVLQMLLREKLQGWRRR